MLYFFARIFQNRYFKAALNEVYDLIGAIELFKAIPNDGRHDKMLDKAFYNLLHYIAKSDDVENVLGVIKDRFRFDFDTFNRYVDILNHAIYGIRFDDVYTYTRALDICSNAPRKWLSNDFDSRFEYEASLYEINAAEHAKKLVKKFMSESSDLDDYFNHLDEISGLPESYRNFKESFMIYDTAMDAALDAMFTLDYIKKLYETYRRVDCFSINAKMRILDKYRDVGRINVQRNDMILDLVDIFNETPEMCDLRDEIIAKIDDIGPAQYSESTPATELAKVYQALPNGCDLKPYIANLLAKAAK